MPHCFLLCPAAQLSVVVYGDTAGLSLTALHGTRIVTVDMSFCKSPPVDSLSGFSELRELDLTRCGLRVVPPALSGLTALEDLNLWGNEQLGQEGGGLEQLATLTRLRSLKLGCCSLRAVPPALSGLTALEDLNLCCNEQRGSGGSQEQLAAMTRLRSLKLLDCGLRAVPPALSRLTALESLDLSCNERLGQEGGGLERLSALTRLRKLSLSGCGLRAVPPALSSLAALEDLNLNSNELGDGSGLLCLAALARLRRLGLAACGLRAMPPTMSLPTTLEDLDLWGNQQLGVEHGGSLERLVALTLLRNLSLGHCGLRVVPLALSRLTALKDLDLSRNWELAGGLEQLAALRCVTLPRPLLHLQEGLTASMPHVQFEAALC